MTDDPKIAAMLAATDFVVRFAPIESTAKDIENAKIVMFDLATEWLSWYRKPRTDFTGPEMTARIAIRGPGRQHAQWCDCDDLCRFLGSIEGQQPDETDTPNPPILYTPGGPPRQLCGAYVEPDWYSTLPAGARAAHPWLVCSGEHDSAGWHKTAPSEGQITFDTHHYVSAWNASGDDRENYPTDRCSCGKAYSAEHLKLERAPS